MKTDNQAQGDKKRKAGKNHQRSGKFSWTPLMQESKETSSGPSERYLHSCGTIGQKLYVLGGANSLGPLKESRLHVLDINCLRWSGLETKSFCEGRSGHSCAVLKQELYFFGGTQEAMLSSAFFKFSPPHNTWTLLQALEVVPPPRELALMVAVRESFLFLYGGIDVAQDTIYQDGYIFTDNEWQVLNITDNISPRVKVRHASCGNRLLLFGGEGPSLDNSLLFNDLHEVLIDEINLELSFREIQVAGPKPPKRTSHGMSGLSQHLIFIYGGEGCDKHGKPTVLDDIWLFDLRQLLWAQVECCEGKLIPRYDFSLCLTSQGLYLFGGFDSDNSIVDSLSRIEHIPQSPQPIAVCASCLALDQPQSGSPYDREASLSGGFLHSMALELAFPFRAVEMLIDSAQLLGSSSIGLSTLKNKEDFDLFSIEFDSPRQLSDACFLAFSGSENEKEGRAVLMMKLGALRIGKTFLYISADQHKRKVVLVSVDNKYAPNFQQSFVHYSYIQDIVTGHLLSCEGDSQKQTIFNILRSQVQDPYTVLSKRKGHLVLIMQANILPTVQKAYYYELINFGKPEHDIKIYFNQKKIELLQSIGLSMSQNPQFSLKNYLPISKLHRSIAITINDSPEPLKCFDYLKTLELYRDLGMVEEVAFNYESKFVEKCRLFQCRKDKYLPYNQSILIYCGGRVVDRFECPFGQLMPTKFFKKKYRKSDATRNLFDVVGVLHVSDKLGFNYTLSKVKDRLRYRQILGHLTSFVASLSPDYGKLQQQLSTLYQWRFSLGREGSKRQKKESAAERAT